MSSTQYSVSAAARITGKGRATIARHCKTGKLSYTVNSEGNKEVAGSELVRVYGNDCDFGREVERTQLSDTNRSDSPSKGEHEAVATARAEQIRQYETQIEYLQQALNKAQESQNRITLLLEQRSNEKGDWQKSLDAMARSLANQTSAEIAKFRSAHDQEIKQLKRALHQERNKSFWRRLVGS
jgi:hypothetical protein